MVCIWGRVGAEVPTKKKKKKKKKKAKLSATFGW